MDTTDRDILALLREDGRASTARLGRKLGLSRTTVHSRIERLLARRVITGFTVRMGAEQEREQIQAHVLITLTPRLQSRAEAALRRLPEVRKLYSGAGCPHFHFDKDDRGRLILGYRSPRQLCHLAHGFIDGATAHFGERAEVEHLMCVHEGAPMCRIAVDWLP